MPRRDSGLEGVAVVITRPANKAGHLAGLIARAGGRPVLFPTLQIEPLEPDREAMRELAMSDTVIFVSANAVEHGFAKLPDGALRGKQLAAIGPATRRALEARGCTDIECPEENSSTEALLQLPFFRDAAGRRIVIARGRGGRETLRESLEALGARVSYLECYQRRMPPDYDPATVVRELGMESPVPAIIATSVEGLANLIAMIPAGHHATLCACPLVVIGDRQKASALRLGWTGPLLVSGADDARIVDTLIDWRHQH